MLAVLASRLSWDLDWQRSSGLYARTTSASSFKALRQTKFATLIIKSMTTASNIHPFTQNAVISLHTFKKLNIKCGKGV